MLTTPYKIKTAAILSSGQKKEINIWGVRVVAMVLTILESKITSGKLTVLKRKHFLTFQILKLKFLVFTLA